MSLYFKDSSPYYSTPIKTWYLDVINLPTVPKNEFDRLYVIPAKYDKRPDLLSNELYGTAKLWWVFSVRNPDALIDPIEDFVTGLEITLPVNILRD